MPEPRAALDLHKDHDLAEILIAAVIANRDDINASCLAHGTAGRVEINVNLPMHRVDLQVFVRDARAA